MTDSGLSSNGIIILAGSEMLRPDSAALWDELLNRAPGKPPQVVVIPAALADERVPALQHRLSLIETTLEQRGFLPASLPVSPETPPDPAQINAAFKHAQVIYLPGGRPLTAVRTLQAGAIWDNVCTRLGKGASLAAGAGAAAALGEVIAVPDEPSAEGLDQQGYRVMPGLGWLPGVMLLPFFDRLTAGLAGRLRELYPEGITILGLDEAAYLVKAGERWQVRGEGVVTFIRQNGERQVINNGMFVPGSLLPDPK